MIRKKIPIVSDRDNYVKVYYSKGSSGDFKEISKIKHPSTSTTITIKDTAEEKLEYKIKYWQKNLTFENGNNSPYINRESNIITFYRLTAPTVETPDVNKKMDKDPPVGRGTILIGDNNNLQVDLELIKDSSITGLSNTVGGKIAEVVQSQQESIVTGVNFVCIYNAETQFYDLYLKEKYGDDPASFTLVRKDAYYLNPPQVGEIIGTASYSAIGGQSNLALGDSSTTSGNSNINLGFASTTVGQSNKIYGGQINYIEGRNNTIKSSGFENHIEGEGNIIFNGSRVHVEGSANYVDIRGEGVHAEGYNNTIYGIRSHTEGGFNYEYAANGHVEGERNYCGLKERPDFCSHAEGQHTIALGTCAHAEGRGENSAYNIAYGTGSHVEGTGTVALGTNQHVFGRFNRADGEYTIVREGGESDGEIINITSSSRDTYIEIVGNGSDSNNPSNARTLDWQGNETIAGTLTCSDISAGTLSMGRLEGSVVGTNSTAEGYNVTASGNNSHAEGNRTIASGRDSHSEGNGTTASGYYSHAEGAGTTASSNCTHAEGRDTVASGSDGSHAEGWETVANGTASHAEGNYTVASG